MSKFPEGPYELHTIEEYKGSLLSWDQGEIKGVFVVGPEKENGGQTYFAQISHNNMTIEEALAMGRLFAAAPEMYETLKAAWHFLQPMLGHPKEIGVQIERVIAKAEGQE